MAWKYVQRNENGKLRTHELDGVVQDVEVDGHSVVNNEGVAEITTPNIPVTDVEVDGHSVVNNEGVAEITLSSGTVTDVEVDGTSVVNAQGVAELTTPTIPVTDVEVDGTSVVNQNGVAEITTPTIPVTDVEVNGVSVVNQQGVAEITTSSGTVTDVEVDGVSVVNQQGVAEITTPTIPVTDVKVNGQSVVSNNEALIKSYKEITQSQYNALPDSKLTDGILYAIKDSGGADGFPPLIYSEEEREVGVWIDGKPLYQKTFISTYSFHQTDTQNITIDISSLSIDTPVSINGFWRRWAGDGNKLYYQFGSDEATYGIGWARVDSENGYTNGQLRIQIKSDGSDYQQVTLRYTKTSDTAGSGTWNQQGVLSHHYSLSEKVIGTWIDGKPLYEKVFYFSNGQSFNNSWKKTDAQIPNIDKIIGGYGIRTGGSGNGAVHPLQIDIDSNAYLEIAGAAWSSSIYYLIVQYTKTTD